MAMLPVPFNDDPGGGLTPRQLAKARRISTNVSLSVHRHNEEARALAEMDAADSQAAGDASTAALDSELDLLDHGLSRAGGSIAKAELVARHVNRLSAINNRRISRTFG